MLLHQLDKRFSFFNNVSSKFCTVTFPYVFSGVNRVGRHEQNLTGLECYRRSALNLIFKQPFKHINYLLTRMLMFWKLFSLSYIDHYLNGLFSRNIQIMTL